MCDRANEGLNGRHWFETTVHHQVTSTTSPGHRRRQVAMGLRIAHPGGLLKGLQVEALTAQPGGQGRGGLRSPGNNARPQKLT